MYKRLCYLNNTARLCYTLPMEVVSELVDIKNNHQPSVEYIENELIKRNINPLRWAIVDVSDKILTVNVANLKE